MGGSHQLTRGDKGNGLRKQTCNWFALETWCGWGVTFHALAMLPSRKLSDFLLVLSWRNVHDTTGFYWGVLEWFKFGNIAWTVQVTLLVGWVKLEEGRAGFAWCGLGRPSRLYGLFGTRVGAARLSLIYLLRTAGLVTNVYVIFNSHIYKKA